MLIIVLIQLPYLTINLRSRTHHHIHRTIYQLSLYYIFCQSNSLAVVSPSHDSPAINRGPKNIQTVRMYNLASLARWTIANEVNKSCNLSMLKFLIVSSGCEADELGNYLPHYLISVIARLDLGIDHNIKPLIDSPLYTSQPGQISYQPYSSSNSTEYWRSKPAHSRETSFPFKTLTLGGIS